ncbi:prolipoprotein diacylglyceryl transferase [Candidatus Peregrinibacteria bacterium CG_4_9_14_0_2_um_filter_53_11]|nr:MAG: prolipoprotein diacylglyceryl transferase [Candidatus Peregrinibacteria bacterium CG_4_9_14_0_2_um_filter_53_11]
MFQSPGSTLLEIGPLTLRWYAIMIVTGMILAYLYVTRAAKKQGLSVKIIEDMAVWLIVAGVLGARLYYVIFNPTYYLAHPLDAFKIWEGGLAIHGGILAGAAAFFIFLRKKKVSWRAYADIIAPGLILAQGLGRWGNFFNSEAFGGPTNLPWKLFIPLDSRPPELREFEYFHPTFLYESLWNILGFVLLALLLRTSWAKNRRGAVLFSYIIHYSVGRFFIEGLRTDSLYLGPLRAAQVASIALVIGGIVGLIFGTRRDKV